MNFMKHVLVITAVLLSSTMVHASKTVSIEVPAGAKVTVNKDGSTTVTYATEQNRVNHRDSNGVCYTIKSGTGLLNYSSGSTKRATKWAKDLGIDYNNGLPKDRKLYINSYDNAKLVFKCPYGSVQK